MTTDSNGAQAWENKMKMWSWRFVVIVAITCLGVIWNNLNSKVESNEAMLEAQRTDIFKVESDLRRKEASDDVFKRSIENRLDRIERKLDKVLD